ncbi:hypothetical protein [Blastochloris viridis]|uniref:Uncharacterized protein n=1 Tax=Blastochloris viridis TaxID=1079 RepID=A0A0H5BQ75_BLAVI|nr:hypothetical protein [Blastochloris viridis]ALK09654.1 hypothetical protein BVIR_1881 [Blastochloris viridis]BAS00459.1 hypothetical protein BV133_2865 [Blastochloris viridis]CUU42317.1 hypothetical protein BVIRIDIS_13260 [Blastochloris viridis]
MNQIVVRILQVASIAAITATLLGLAAGPVSQSYFGAALVVAVVLTGFGTWFLQWAKRRWRGGAG